MATKKLDKISIVWQTERERHRGYRDLGYVWFAHKDSIKQVIDSILQSCRLDIDDKIDFIKDMLNGKVMVGRGYNTDLDVSSFTEGDFYTACQYSIRDFQVGLCIKGRTSYPGWCTWRYLIVKLDQLPEDVMEYARNELSKIVDKGNVDKTTYTTFYNLLCIFGANINDYLGVGTSYGNNKIEMRLDLTTTKLLDLKEYMDTMQKVHSVIDKALEYTEAITGYKIQLNKDYGCSIAQCLDNTRELTEDNFEIEEKGNKSKTISEVLQDVIDKNIIIHSNILDNTIQSEGSIDDSWDGFDNSIITLDIEQEKIPWKKWIKYPETLVIQDEDEEGYINNYTLILWGKTKTMYETLGKDRFLTFMNNKLN